MRHVGVVRRPLDTMVQMTVLPLKPNERDPRQPGRAHRVPVPARICSLRPRICERHGTHTGRSGHRSSTPRPAGDHPQAADHRPGPARRLRPATGSARSHRLALVGQLARAVQRSLRITGPSNHLTTQPQPAQPQNQWKNRTHRQPPHAYSTYTASESSATTYGYFSGGLRLKVGGRARGLVCLAKHTQKRLL